MHCATHNLAVFGLPCPFISTRNITMQQVKGLITIAACALAASTLPAGPAQAELSANIGVVSNYYFRGFSESDNGAAVQGGLDYEHGSGFYLGTWASNVDFGDGTSYELDLYLGFAQELDNGFGYDFGFLYYAYPDAPGSADFAELYGEFSYSLFSAGVNWTVVDSSDSVLESGDLYFHAGLEVPLSEDYGLGFLVGRTHFDDSDRNYTHYRASLTRDTDQFGSFGFHLEYEDTFQKDLKAWVGWNIDF
jgi:uncharacterized protein (TIGR02001 family)